ncbi:MAG: peptidoglycan DD-metalloendopeptidase family protein [Armatimonadetes bacterium]|nr:peptidoglycan DD-metalloendopeptidase family protein [Armatimonadota bacterium]
MGSKARLFGIGMLSGMLMLPAHIPQPLSPGPSATPFLQAVQTQAAVSQIFTTLFHLAPPRPETASATSQPAPSPTTVVVKEGQSVWDIANAYGVSVDSIIAANDLRNADLIKPGLRLLIPRAGAALPAQKPAVQKPAVQKAPSKAASPSKTQPARQPRPEWIVVRQGQTLSEIAEEHGTSVSAFVRANGLRSAELIREGQRLAIPGRQAASRRLTIASPVPVSRTQAVVARVSGFLWPARGVLTSRFGWRWRQHHDGIDIAAPRGAPIHAAKAGRVIFAGWYYGYGRAIIIDHGGGLTTLYGHASKLLASNGQAVQAGELIARVGCTGHCSGSHLHFEIRVNGKAVNPLKYL